MARRVVALVINYRDARRTSDCVRSLLSGTVVRCVVWDNSEDDGRSADQLKASFDGDDRIELVVSRRNLGFAAGVNRGLEVCRRSAPDAWVLMINNDALAPITLSGDLALALETRPGALIAFPALMHAGHRLDEVYYQRWLGLITTQPWPGAFRLPRGCCLMLATDRWPDPLFDEAFFMYGEEIALGWSLHGQPEALCLVDSVCVEHEGSASSGLGSPFYEERMVAAHLILSGKLGRNTWEKSMLLAWRTPMLILRATLRACRYRSVVPLTALWKGWRIFRSQARQASSVQDR